MTEFFIAARVVDVDVDARGHQVDIAGLEINGDGAPVTSQHVELARRGVVVTEDRQIHRRILLSDAGDPEACSGVEAPKGLSVDHERRPVLYLPDGRALVRTIGFKP